MRAAFLIRCSTKKQDYERQVNDLTRLAKKFGYTSSDNMIFGEHITGKDDASKRDRQSIQRLKDAAINKEFDVVLVSEVSRITFSGDWSSVRKVGDGRPTLRIVENPVGDELRLDGHDSGRPTTLTVYSIAGRQAVRISSWNGESVNVSTLPKGVYLLQADNVTLKFMKK